MYEVAISGGKFDPTQFDRNMTKAVRKWLEVPHCLSNVALYGRENTNDQLGGGVHQMW